MKSFGFLFGILLVKDGKLEILVIDSDKIENKGDNFKLIVFGIGLSFFFGQKLFIFGFKFFEQKFDFSSISIVILKFVVILEF